MEIGGLRREYTPSEIQRKLESEWDAEYISSCLQDFSDTKIRWLAEKCGEINSYKNRREQNGSNR